MSMPEKGTKTQNYLMDGDRYIPCAICGEPICTSISEQIGECRQKVISVCKPIEIYPKIIRKAYVKMYGSRKRLYHANVKRRYSHPECHAIGFGVARRLPSLKLCPPATVYHVAHGRLTDAQIGKLRLEGAEE